MTKRSTKWMSAIGGLSVLALLLASCAPDQPRNGAGQPVDRNTGTVAPGAPMTQ